MSAVPAELMLTSRDRQAQNAGGRDASIEAVFIIYKAQHTIIER
jgi:hypothetical protein